MRVLIGCEFSGVVRDAFRAVGHDAVSCDLLPSESSGPHIQGDIRSILQDGWDCLIAFPPCTHLCVSGARWGPQKWQMADKLLQSSFLCRWQSPQSHGLPSRTRWG